jgi:hypothetical protein
MVPPAIKHLIFKSYRKYGKEIIAEKNTLRSPFFDIAPLLRRLRFVGVGVGNGRPKVALMLLVALMLPVGFAKPAETVGAL